MRRLVEKFPDGFEGFVEAEKQQAADIAAPGMPKDAPPSAYSGGNLAARLVGENVHAF